MGGCTTRQAPYPPGFQTPTTVPSYSFTGAPGAFDPALGGSVPGALPGAFPGTVPGALPGAFPGTVPGALPGAAPGLTGPYGLPPIPRGINAPTFTAPTFNPAAPGGFIPNITGPTMTGPSFRY